MRNETTTLEKDVKSEFGTRQALGNSSARRNQTSESCSRAKSAHYDDRDARTTQLTSSSGAETRVGETGSRAVCLTVEVSTSEERMVLVGRHG